jgi:hypothetical protein
MIDLETIRVADECWVALAVLHREHPDRLSFSPGEVYNRLKEEGAHPEVRPGVKPHIYLHNVANRPPNSARYRLFYRLEDDTLRLFRPGDECDPTRNGKTKPERSDLPEKYHPLLDWYENEYCKPGAAADDVDPVLAMRGVGKEIWADEGGDAYVERERNAWRSEAYENGAARNGTLTRRVWQRVVAHQGEEFHTRTGKGFTYRVDGESGLWFYRDGRRINKRLWKGHLEKAVFRCPLDRPTDIADCYDSSYLFGLLMDDRIRGTDW